MFTILLLGGHGLLGSEIAKLISKSGVYKLLNPQRNELDLLSSDDVFRYFRKHKPDIVIHAAATVYGVGGNKTNSQDLLHNNICIDMNIINAAACFPPGIFFYASSVAIYGFPYSSDFINEKEIFSGAPHESEFSYAMEKRFMFAPLRELEKLGVTIIYSCFTNLYGVEDNFNEFKGHVIPSLIARAIKAAQTKEKILNVWGDRENSRDFMHANDAARAVTSIISSNRLPSFLVINIGTGVSTTIGRIADILVTELGLYRPCFNTNGIVTIPKRNVDVSLLFSEYNFRPKIKVDEGLRSLVATIRTKISKKLPIKGWND